MSGYHTNVICQGSILMSYVRVSYYLRLAMLIIAIVSGRVLGTSPRLHGQEDTTSTWKQKKVRRGVGRFNQQRLEASNPRNSHQIAICRWFKCHLQVKQRLGLMSQCFTSPNYWGYIFHLQQIFGKVMWNSRSPKRDINPNPWERFHMNSWVSMSFLMGISEAPKICCCQRCHDLSRETL